MDRQFNITTVALAAFSQEDPSTPVLMRGDQHTRRLTQPRRCPRAWPVPTRAQRQPRVGPDHLHRSNSRSHTNLTRKRWTPNKRRHSNPPSGAHPRQACGPAFPDLRTGFVAERPHTHPDTSCMPQSASIPVRGKLAEHATAPTCSRRIRGRVVKPWILGPIMYLM
jgi:hypothetical protein